MGCLGLSTRGFARSATPIKDCPLKVELAQHIYVDRISDE